MQVTVKDPHGDAHDQAVALVVDQLAGEIVNTLYRCWVCGVETSIYEAWECPLCEYERIQATTIPRFPWRAA